MAKPVALAKISVPRMFGTMPRERLYALLDMNHDRPLEWICGPPGAGKTVLVAGYLVERNRHAFWYQVDGGDSDPATLFHFLSRASDAAAGNDAATLPKFLPEHQGDLSAFARLYFRAFFARSRENSVLVLDNCQEAMADGAFQEAIRQAVLETPPGFGIIAISRVEAPPGFAQFTASGAMSTIRWDQLQLTLDEVRAIAAQSEG